MMESIAKIKNGTYVDEEILIDTEEDEKKSNASVLATAAPARAQAPVPAPAKAAVVQTNIAINNTASNV